MGIVAESTGHSRPQERKVANWLYVSIGAAIVLAAIVFLLMSRRSNMQPTQLDHTSTSSGTAEQNQAQPNPSSTSNPNPNQGK